MAESVIADVLRKIAGRRNLTAAETEAAFTEVVEGRASDVQKAALLMGLRAKGETPEEVVGGVRALQRAMIPVTVPAPDTAVDTCGTGGGSLTTFNISTAAAFVAAAGGVPVAKHGNRSFTSKCGSADVLEALGVRIDLGPERAAEVLSQVGITFLFAPNFHPAMRHFALVRRELGVPTVMNILGPLANPARVRRQVLGVPDPALLELVSGALRELGHLRAVVAHGFPGMDELSPIGVTEIVEVDRGSLRRYPLDAPREMGWEERDPQALAGSDPSTNAQVIEAVLSGRLQGPARRAVALNAGAAFYVAERADSMAEGIRQSEQVLQEGGAWEVLQRLREATR